jgi:hypothetical protein
MTAGPWPGGVIRRAVPMGIALGTLALVVGVAVQTGLEDPKVGIDFLFYREAGLRWLETGEFYLPGQLSGEYQLKLMVDVLYPPTALLLFVPLALLPIGAAAVAWWAIPAAVLARQVWVERPAPWAWSIAALLLLWPRSYGSVLWGNTDIWVVAAVSAGFLWGWPALLAVLKPSFAPFALVGIRRRSWWVAAAVVLAFSIAALPLWFDYFRAMAGVRGLGLDYSLLNLPIAFIPLVLHLGRTRQAPTQLEAAVTDRRTLVGTDPKQVSKADPLAATLNQARTVAVTNPRLGRTVLASLDRRLRRRLESGEA